MNTSCPPRRSCIASQAQHARRRGQLCTDATPQRSTYRSQFGVQTTGATSEATAIQWTLWGKQAENAAEYLGKGSRVNVVGRLRNNNYDKDGSTVYGFQFTCEELDYLDSKADADARRTRQDGSDEDAPKAAPQRAGKTAPRGRTSRSASAPAAN